MIRLNWSPGWLFLMVFITVFTQISHAKADSNKQDELTYCIELIDENKIEKADEVIRAFLESDLTENEKVNACYKIAVAYNNNLYYNLSIAYASEGIEYLTNNNTYLLPQLSQVIVVNHLDLGNYDLAESFYRELAKIKTGKENNIKANELNLIGEIQRLKGEYSNSINYYNKAIRINRQYNYLEQLAINYNNIGLSYLYLDNIDSAKYFLDNSLKLIDSLGLSSRKSAINNSFGELYLKQGNIAQALSYFQKTLNYDLSNHPDENEILRDAHKGMSDCYELAKDFENALINYKRYIKYQSIILDYNQNAIVLQHQILSDRKAHKNEMELVNSKLELEKKINRLTSILLVIVSFIVVLVIYLYWVSNKKIKQKIELEKRKNKIKELEIEKVKLSKSILESELKNSEQDRNLKKIEQIRLQEKLHSKNRELASAAIHIMSKNEILESIRLKISEINAEKEVIPRKSYMEINFIISDCLRMDEDWKIFKRHFTEVHPLFFEKLKAEFPNITTDELKMCAYLKIQLSSKEIARLLNVTVAAVNKRRNRLRKKLDILSNDDFYGFFLRNDFL